MRRMVITGANSFIGRQLTIKAVKAGWEVVLVTRNPIQDLLQIKQIHLCLEDYHQIGELVGPCDCFVHLAWNGTRAMARMDRDLQQANLEFSIQGVRSMLYAGCGRVVTAGSQAEYGPHKEIISEDCVCSPNTEYGKAKLEFYEQTAMLCENNGVEYKEPRFFSLYGPSDFDGTMVISILRDMLAGRPCQLTKGIQMWDFLHIEDAMNALVRLCEIPCPNGVYNFGSGDVRMLRDYVLEMARITETKSNLLFGSVPYPKTGMVSLWPDISKLKRELNWCPQISFAEGIQAVLDAFGAV